MKKHLLLIANILLIVSLFAQKPSLTKAYNSFYDKDYDKAKVQIDLCTTDEKLSAKAQTWLYKGNIEMLLANREYSEKQKNESYLIRYPDAPVEAFDAFQKALSINPKVEALDMMNANDALKQLYPYLLVRGVDQLIAKDNAGAKATLAKGIQSYEMGTPQYPMNGELYYYYAYALESLGETDEMMRYYQKALEDGSQNPYVFAKLFEFYKTSNDRTNAEKTLALAKEKNPNDINVKLLEIDLAYWSGDSTKARTLVDQLDPYSLKNPDEMVNVANFYIKEKRYESAERLLSRANALSPNNFVILYNLGVCSYSISEYYFNRQNQLAIQQGAKADIDAAKQQSEKHLADAANYFEQARKLQSGDLNLLNTLRAIYVRQQSPKADEIDALIKQLEK
jgi:tetratricopeptide (TPR) repeat protein